MATPQAQADLKRCVESYISAVTKGWLPRSLFWDISFSRRVTAYGDAATKSAWEAFVQS